MADCDGSDDPEDNSYFVEHLISEGWIKERDGKEAFMYLIKWEGYGLHESTWEPPQNLAGTNFLENWADEKQRMGVVAFQEQNARKKAEYDAAVRKHLESDEKDKESGRHEHSWSAADNDDSEDDTPLALRKQRIEQQTASHKSTLANSGPRDSNPLHSLFQDSQDVQQSYNGTNLTETEGDLFVRQTPIPRKPPFHESGSSSSSSSSSLEAEAYAEEAGSMSEDSVMGKTLKKAHKPNRKSVDLSSFREKSTESRDFAKLRKDSTKGSVPTSKTIKAAKRNEPKAKRPNEVSKPSSSWNTPASREKVCGSQAQNSTSLIGNSPQLLNPTIRTSSSIQHKSNSNAGHPNFTTADPSRSKDSNNANTSTPSKLSASSSFLTVTDCNDTTSKTSSGTRIINQPKPKVRQWQNGDAPFLTLRARRVANVRSRTEGTPDLGVLEFPGGSPAGLPKVKPRAPIDNPYARRETGAQRLPEGDLDNSSRRQSMDVGLPLADWEVDKVPMVCYDHRTGNNCRHGARKCHFMHRNKDPDDKDYPMADAGGYIPPKYRKPPLTCPFWLKLRGGMGCFKSDEECGFAHENTQWMPGYRDEPVRISPELIRAREENRRRPSQPNIGQSTVRNFSRSEVTCWFWKHQKCNRLEEVCEFRHHDTGTVANAPATVLTCRYWADGDKCVNNARECRFQHYHTGFMSDYFEKESEPVPPSSIRELSSDKSKNIPCSESNRESQVRTEDFRQESVDEAFPLQSPQHSIEQSSALTPVLPPLPPPPPPPPQVQPSAGILCSSFMTKAASICKVNFLDAFASNNTEKETGLVDRRAFLIYHPQEHSEELDLMTRWLLTHHVEVGNAWYEGSWNNFRQQVLNGGSGVIFVHPDFEYFTELSEFGKVLRKQVRLWAIGIQEGIEHSPGLPDSAPNFRHDCIEIFPLGGLIYITDDVFEKKPQLALNIVQLFLKKINKLRQLAGPISPWQELGDASLLWRLCVRPELMEYLLQYCESHVKKLEAGDPDVRSVAEIYMILSEANHIEQDDPSIPLSLIPDKYPILSERRAVAESLDYFNARGRSQEEANLHMIRYYAGLQVDMRRDYRYFYVVHTEPWAPCVQRWKKEIQTLAEVFTPEKCVKELEKEGQGTSIDFCERYMPEHKAEKSTEHQIATKDVRMDEA